jgi:tetratricopeptide (TPR) repeat protein
MLQGDATSALEHFRAAARQEPDMPIYRNGLADALMALARHEDAIEELRLALDHDPRYWAARERLLRCLEHLGRFEEAVAERLRDSSANGPVFEAALRTGGTEGYLLARAGEVRKGMARTTARLAPGAEPSPGDLFTPPELALALAHAELQEWEEARAWEEHACARQPWRIALVQGDYRPTPDGTAPSAASCAS